MPVRIGQVQIFPDLVLSSLDGEQEADGDIEVETAESVNHLEAMAQWAHFGRARVAFHLYVPAGCVDIARRLASENDVNVAEIWSYHTIGDQTRFTLVHRTPVPEPRRTPEPRKTADAAKATVKAATKAGEAKPRAKAKKPAAAAAAPRKAAAKTTRASGAKRAAPAAKSARTQKRK